MIEPETGEWFLGNTTLEALKKAKEKYPDKISYCIRVGFPAVHEQRGASGKYESDLQGI